MKKLTPIFFILVFVGCASSTVIEKKETPIPEAERQFFLKVDQKVNAVNSSNDFANWLKCQEGVTDVQLMPCLLTTYPPKTTLHYKYNGKMLDLNIVEGAEGFRLIKGE